MATTSQQSAGRRTATERFGAALAAAAAATTTRGSGCSGVRSLPRVPTLQLDAFCVGAVDHPNNSASLRLPSHCALRQLAGQINKVNGEPTVRVRSGKSEFLALVDSGASRTVMRRDTFEKISGSNKEEVGSTGIDLTTANDQPLATAGTFLVKLDIEGLGRITHPVVVVEKLAWPLLLGYDVMAIYGAKLDAGRTVVTWDWEGARKRAEVVLAKQENLPAYSMQIVKARIGRKRTAGMAFTLDSGHSFVVSGLYYVNRQGKTHICLVNETAEEVVIVDNELPGEHIPVRADDMVTLGELLTVQTPKQSQQSEPTKDKVQIIEEMVSGQRHLSRQQQEHLREVLLRHHEAVWLGKSDMSRSTAVPHVLRPKTGEPAYVKQFPIPAAHLHFINEQIDKLLALGAIREDWVSPHNSPVFAVKKPQSEELRLFIDVRKVNEILWDDFHSFIDVTSCLQRLGGLEAKFLTALDLVNTYWQLELAEESQEYTAFTVPGRGKIVWTVTPMGLKTSPSAFSRLMKYVFKGFHNAVIYLDDVLIGSGTWEQHMTHLDQALARMKRHNLKIKECKFAEASVEYLGYTISASSITPGEGKTAVVRNFAPPQTVKKICRFTGRKGPEVLVIVVDNRHVVLVCGRRCCAPRRLRRDSADCCWGARCFACGGTDPRGTLPRCCPESLRGT